MQETMANIIKSVFENSNNGSIHFGEVVANLIEINVDSYHVDYRSGRTTYFLPNGETLDFYFEKPRQSIALHFNRDEVITAIRGAQQGNIMYPEFKNLTQAAGCVSYTVWIKGKHITYFGKNGETHVENFPS